MSKKPKIQNVTETGTTSSSNKAGAEGQRVIDASLPFLLSAINRGPFQGPFIGDQSQISSSVFDQALGAASSGFPGQADAEAAIRDRLNFQNAFLSHPSLAGVLPTAVGLLGDRAAGQFDQASFDAAARPVEQAFNRGVSQLAGRFSNSGRLRGGGAEIGQSFDQAEESFGRTLAALAADIGARNQDRNFSAAQTLASLGLALPGQARADESLRLQAALGFPQVTAGGLSNLSTLAGLGGVQEARSQAEADAQRLAFAEAFRFPAEALTGVGIPLAGINASSSGTQTHTTPHFGPSTFSQIAGLGLGAAGLALSPVSRGGTTVLQSLLR